MPVSKEVRTQIQSIQNTQKITKAMEMVAASKMRRAQDQMRRSRPYVRRIRQAIGHLAASTPTYQNKFLEQRDSDQFRRVGFIVVSTDRGLCGGLNVNLFKQVVLAAKHWSEKKVDVELCVIGSKAEAWFKAIGMPIIGQSAHIGDSPKLDDIIGVVKVMFDGYSNAELDSVYLCYNDFVNTMSQTPTVQQILPLQPDEDEQTSALRWDYIYEPEPQSLIEMLLTRYIESQVYQAVVENLASEQAARMIAMKSASDNAGELISDLRLVYNKARQAAITKELSEIVGGAEAV